MGLGGTRFSGSYRNRRQEPDADTMPFFTHIT